jgi:hypothetical protein
MAIDTVHRWQLVREVIVQRKSGAIVLQTGRNYIHWIIDRGRLVCVSSTLPEASLTNTILEQKIINPAEFVKAQSMVDQNRTLGAILVQRKMLDQEALEKFIWQHWISCTDYLFEPSMHLFWSVNSSRTKSELVRCDRPFSDVLLRVQRSSITIPTALRAVKELKTPYKLTRQMPDISAFSEEERRIWMHLRSGSGLNEIFRDAEVARISCYKTLFLLWVTGHICQPTEPTVKKVTEATKTAANRIPAEWIFPLCAGALIGVLLAPSNTHKEQPKPAPKVERLHDSLQKPAWTDSDPDAKPPSRNEERE